MGTSLFLTLKMGVLLWGIVCLSSGIELVALLILNLLLGPVVDLGCLRAGVRKI